MTDNPQQTAVASLKMSIAGRPIEAQIEVPQGPTRPRELLPILQWFTGEVVEAACDQVQQEGRVISCQAGCGACCRQLVPISRAEAYQISELVEQLPEPRRGEIQKRFRQAEERLAAVGLFEGLMEPKSLPVPVARSLGLDYFALGIACPFLEEESCSIHPDRPLACREYLVTSPAENCRQPTAETIDMVQLPARVSKAWLDMERGHAKGPAWVPLSLAPQWAARHPEPPPRHSGPELLGDVFQRLSGNQLPTEGDSDSTPANPAEFSSAGPSESISSQAQQQAQAYDEVPYESGAFAFTHPNSMAAIATLYGMTPPAVATCRVLELGCAEGGNLIPMALGLPEGRFVGIDLSPRQVAAGQQQIDELALKNVDLRVMDLMDVDASFGKFDYIICHGLYSWVPCHVQEKILAICSDHLAPQGVAFVSFNAYPGWHTRKMVREMVLYHIDAAAPPRERVRQAREFLDFLVENCTSPKSVYAATLRAEQALWKKSSDAYLRHDQLGEVNEPCYFHQFAAQLASHDLQYISEAKLADNAALPSDEVQARLRASCGDLVRFEQHLDFLIERTFRRSLICHKQSRLQRTPPPNRIEQFLLSARGAELPSESPGDSAASSQFRTHDGVCFSTSDPWMRAALLTLFRHWPRMLTFEEVCSESRRELNDSADARLDPIADPTVLKLPLLHCGMKGLIELHVRRWPDVAEISSRPQASPFARLQARSSQVVTSWRLDRVQVDDLERQILHRLDGQHTRADLVEFLTVLTKSGELASILKNDDGSLPDASTLAAWLDSILIRFAAFGLLHR